MNHFRTLLLAWTLMSGCGVAYKDRSPLLKDVPLHDVVLHCAHTGIADISMKIPLGFEVSDMRETRDDKFLIGRATDSEPVSGQIVVTITPRPGLQIADTSEYARSGGKVFDTETIWREFTLTESDVDESDGMRIFQREAISPDHLERFNKQRGQPLFLHLLVAGSDSATVERLVACVETMKFQPPKGNL